LLFIAAQDANHIPTPQSCASQVFRHFDPAKWQTQDKLHDDDSRTTTGYKKY
jgi:hypothetical protein